MNPVEEGIQKVTPEAAAEAPEKKAEKPAEVPLKERLANLFSRLQKNRGERDSAHGTQQEHGRALTDVRSRLGLPEGDEIQDPAIAERLTELDAQSAEHEQAWEQLREELEERMRRAIKTEHIYKIGKEFDALPQAEQQSLLVTGRMSNGEPHRAEGLKGPIDPESMKIIAKTWTEDPDHAYETIYKLTEKGSNVLKDKDADIEEEARKDVAEQMAAGKAAAEASTRQAEGGAHAAVHAGA